MTITRLSQLLNGIINAAINQASDTLTGLIASPPYEITGGFNEDLGDAGGSMWVVDVDTGTVDASGQSQPLMAVPIAANNRDIIYADIGKAVQLRRMFSGQWVVVGLSKTALNDTEITYMIFTDDIAVVTRTVNPTVRRRALTFGELGTIKPFGLLPFGAWGVFDSDGNLIKVMEI